MYDDNIFKIEPIEGVVWPNSSIEVKVYFSPIKAGDQNQIAYCEVEGRESRLPLQLKGEAIGPKARFSYDLLDLENLFINTTHKYEVILENRGEIPTHFKLIESQTLFGPKFSFKPSEGSIAAGEQKMIEITFCSDILGEFSEEFSWNLKGSTNPLTLSFKGNIMGPTFKFSSKYLDFGMISYGFPVSRKISLFNTSNIPMDYVLRVDNPEDVDQIVDFRIHPERQRIAENSKVDLVIYAQPRKVQKTSFEVLVDVESVGNDMLRLPVHADIVVPNITVVHPIIEFGDCYLSYSYMGHIELVNDSPFPASYEMLTQEESAKNVYKYSSKSASGVIEPHSHRKVDLDVQIKRLWQVNFPIFIRIAGKESLPIAVDISANGIGPNVQLSTKEINWGKIPVLSKTPFTLTMKNDSPIVAQFSCTTTSDDSVFDFEPKNGFIHPGTTHDIVITAFLDDAIKFTDILKIAVQSDGIYEVQLVARGQGTTIVFPEALRTIDFKDIFSNCDCVAEFTLVNKGRRAQTIHWTKEDARSSGRDPALAAPQIFEVIPTRFSLKPGASQPILIKGFSSKAISTKEKLVCQTTIDKEPTRKIVVESIVAANFINPLIQVTPSILKFQCIRTTDEPFPTLEYDLTLCNTTSLALSTTFKCPDPFKIEATTIPESLGPQETAVVKVKYDPSFNSNRVSSKEYGKLVISYKEHPQKDIVELFSEISFPNLTFSVNTLRFGCIERDHEQLRTMTVSNTSTLPVTYQWYFLESPEIPSSENLSQIFDIQPLRGVLEPGEKQDVEVYFYGKNGSSFHVKAMCDVVGGPKYELNLQGEASTIESAIDKTVLDFGNIPYQSIAEQDIVISNPGLVSFDFAIIIFPSSPLVEKLMVTPALGTILPKVKQKISVRFCPCVPEAVNEYLFIQIAHYEPTKINIIGGGTALRLKADIPRLKDAKFDTALYEVYKKRGRDHQSNEAQLEAETKLYISATKEFVKKLSDEMSKSLLAAELVRGKFCGSPVIFYKASQKKASKEKRITMNEISSVYLTNYVCDFGTVICGTTNRKTFRLFNNGSQSVSFSLDKTHLTGTGFYLEPDKIKSLPVGEGIEFNVTYAAKHLSEGVDVNVPISISGGPSIGLYLRSNIAIPEIRLSDDSLDFGEVVCGFRHTLFFQLHNISHVITEWSAGVPEPPGAEKKGNKKSVSIFPVEFEIIPQNGVLQVQEKINVMLRFMPSEEKQFDLTLPIKIAMNPKSLALRIAGQGVKPRIKFDSESLSIGPILPYSDGVVTKFCITNPTKVPLEVFSTEFDQQHIEEEDLIRKISPNEHQFVISPREVGAVLPAYFTSLVSEGAKLEVDESVLANRPSKIAEDTTNIEHPKLVKPSSPPTSLTNPPLGFHASPYSTESMISLMEPIVSIILHGPPFSGRTVQAKKIATQYGKCYIHMDSLIESLIISNDDYRKDKGSIQNNEEHYPNVKVENAKDDDAHFKLHDLGEYGHAHVSEEAIYEDIRQKVHKDDKQGFVFDGLDSKYISNQTSILKSLVRIFSEKGRRAIMFNLGLDVSKIRDRELVVSKKMADKELQSLHIKELTEDEYDDLSEADRALYDTSMCKYKKRLKELQDKRRDERRHAEEELANKSGERKLEEDSKSKAKKARKTAGQRPAASDKPDKPSTTNKSDSKTGKGKGPGSPKLARKAGADRTNDKENRSNDKSDRGNAFSSEKDGVDDAQGRFNISEDMFVNEQTFKRLDSYYSAIDAFAAFFKDTEKSTYISKSPQPTIPVPIDKKGKSAKPALGSENTVNSDNEGHSVDEQPISFFEINTNNQDEDSVFKSLTEHIPSSIKYEESKDQTDIKPQPIIEQIYFIPKDREPVSSVKHFVVLPNQFSGEGEDENSFLDQVGNTSTTTGAQNIGTNKTQLPQIGAGGQTQTQQQLANDNKPQTDSSKPETKKMKPLVKVFDESKPEAEPEGETESTNKYRWVVNPGEKKDINVKFAPMDVGRFDQVLNFEIVGSVERFSLPCTGICQYNQISTDYRKIFPKWKKTKESDSTDIHAEYIANTGTFEFGPLLFSKPRDKYLEKFPDNKVVITLTNPCSTEIKAAFALRNDSKAEVFFFEPSTLDLAPGQSQTVSIWAYPPKNSQFEDQFLICIKDNPEPFSFKISCIGVKPELEVDKKQLVFDKMLLGRTEKRELRVKNPTPMPVGWKISGIESLGEEFGITPIEGVLEASQECVINATFHGTKVLVIKRSIKLEASDPEKIGGVSQEIPILVTAEAYDIAIDLHFPKGFEGGLDFGIIKVFEESKQLCTLKNKGKYEVGFRFLFDTPELNDYFTIVPMQGVIQPSDKPYFVQVNFKTNVEVSIKETTSIRCMVFEPTTGEVTAAIPIKVSARSVFSKFNILPVRDLNFGALIHGSKVSRQFTIENFGEFDFRYSIYKVLANIIESKTSGGKPRTSSRHGKPSQRTSSPPPAAKAQNSRKEVVKQSDVLNFGAFTVSPTSGLVTPGSKLSINVDFHPESPGSYEEIIGFDISDRAPPENADVLEYRLIGESCVPGINTTEFSSIFEEQSVCKRLELFNTQSSVYAEEDRVFYFGAYLAGQQVQVHFKISNPFKITCDVSLSTKPRGKTKTDTNDFAFDVEPKRLTIPSHEYRYITVSFHPTSIQAYAGIFEAVVDNVNEGKNKTLSFELRGEGTLPRIIVEKPSLKSKNGLPLLKFKRLLVGTSQSQNIILRNDGIIPAKFKLEWVFKDSDDVECSLINVYHNLKPQEVRAIEVKCRPLTVRKMEGELRLKVQDNSFEDSSIQVLAEGYLDDVTFEKLPDDAENEITFADCFIGEQRQITFKARNHSAENVRIAFSDIQEFVFSPSTCHLKPHSDRDITVTFCPKQALEIQRVPMVVRSSKIRLSTQQDVEWDDRMKIIRWVGADSANARANGGKKVIEHLQEPAYDLIGQPNEFTIFMSANADFSSFECDVTNINFKSTLMFQTRVYRFSLRNPGKILLRFSFTVYGEDGFPVDESSNTPFSVSPSSGTILPNETLIVTLKFSPVDVGDYNGLIVCNIPNMAKEQTPPQIQVHGASLRPFCHFELEDSDYITNERRNPDRIVSEGIPAALEANTKVIEFSSCGVRGKNMKRFYIVNPTNMSYEFSWTMVSNPESKIFKCYTPRGIVAPNKKSEVIFEFSPETIDIKESLWNFTILDHNIRIPFLLVGQAMEPNVYVDHTGVNFKSVLVGHQVKEIVKLCNDELSSFSFAFNDTSVEMGHEGIPVLRFSPTSGVIAPRSEIPIEILFSPSAEKTFNFNLVCNIKKKPTPVTINVKGEGYDIHDSLQTELGDGSIFELAPAPAADNFIDFGQVQINEKRLKRVYIINSGKFNFDFAWKFPTKNGGVVSITPEIGTVPKGERIYCEIVFLPTVAAPVKNVRAICNIINGLSYPISILGTGTKPLLRFSETQIDFGSQFLYKSGMTAATSTVEITNADLKDISFDIVSLDVPWLEIQRGVNTLAPRESTKFTFVFFPRDQNTYSTTIKFEVNGLSSVELPIKGEGVEYRIECDQRQLNFGAIRIDHAVVRSVKITNRSKLGAIFNIGPILTIENLASYGVQISQIDDINLKPKSSVNLDFKFHPHARIPPFSEELFVEAPGISKQLLVIAGACQGTEVRLENDTLPFGAVVQKSSTTRRIELQNIGDIGAKFYWDIQAFTPDFSISPIEGYISPGMNVPLEITFHPSELSQDIRYENIACDVEGAQTLYLTLTGMCIPQPTQNDVVKFSSPVRSPDTKSITLVNKTNAVWHIRPIFENDIWSGPDIVEIEPGQTKAYDVTFLPIETNTSSESGHHEGSVFFPLPDGSGILYKLIGTADKPLTAGNISREIPCKTPYTEVLPIANWLKRPQRFKVIIEVPKTDPSVIIKGHDFIDVPPLLSKDYKLSFYAYKEGITNFKVIFKNETSQEYTFYNYTVKSTPPGVIASFDLSTPVRQLVTKEVILHNPLANPVQFNGTSNNSDLAVPHSFTIPPKSDGTFTMEFLPLQPKEVVSRISLTSTDLGLYQYDLKLTALPANAERSLHFKVGLGGTQLQTFRFMSYAKVKTDYVCKIDSPDFSVEKGVTAPAGNIQRIFNLYLYMFASLVSNCFIYVILQLLPEELKYLLMWYMSPQNSVILEHN